MKSKDLISIKTALIAFIFFMGMFFLINGSFIGTAKLLEITGGHNILDMELRGYTAEKAYNILEALGEDGRAFNIKYIIPLDFPFPLSYGFFYFTVLSLVAKHLFIKMKSPWLFGLFGVAATFFDWAENVAIIQLLKHYPQQLKGIAATANLFTQLKSLFILSSVGLIFLGLMALLMRKIYFNVRGKMN